MPDKKKGYVDSVRLQPLSVFSKLYNTVLVDLLHEEKEPIEWRNLHVGAERGVNCEHMQSLLTNILQRHWEWQEGRRPNRNQGLDVMTAFHMASPQWYRGFSP